MLKPDLVENTEILRKKAQCTLEAAGFVGIQAVGEICGRVWLDGGTVSRRQDARNLLKSTIIRPEDQIDFV